MEVALFEPEIPPNTGNIARLCAAFNITLHLIEPLGFRLENRYLKRAGLDYWPHVELFVWRDFTHFIENISINFQNNFRLVLATTKGRILLPKFEFLPSDILVFGPETRGLPPSIFSLSPFHVRIPSNEMQEGGVRSLNLATACGIFLYAGLVSSGLIANYK